MAKFHNIKETKKVGKHIKEIREAKELSIEDVSFMTGFTRNTITGVEKGINTDTSHLIEIAKALGVHPMSLFDVPFVIKPRNPLPAQKKARILLTARINKLVSETNFFSTPKFVHEVLNYFLEEYKVKPDPVQTSAALKRKVKEGKLKFVKVGHDNHYSLVEE